MPLDWPKNICLLYLKAGASLSHRHTLPSLFNQFTLGAACIGNCNGDRIKKHLEIHEFKTLYVTEVINLYHLFNIRELYIYR
jgi:hypothetical protein